MSRSIWAYLRMVSSWIVDDMHSGRHAGTDTDSLRLRRVSRHESPEFPTEIRIASRVVSEANSP